MPDPSKVLILGGTAEARAFVEAWAGDRRVALVSSLAGRTRSPVALPGELRIGGFGGVDGLVRYLGEETIDLVVDATHPFAARISRNTAEACARTAVPRLLLQRPAWTPKAGDRWIDVADTAAASKVLQTLGQRVFLSLGRQDLEPFASLADRWFLLRLVDPPSGPLPLSNYEILIARGPFEASAEIERLQRHRIDVLVSRNSGGHSTAAKLAAARTLGLPVVMISRPPVPSGEVAATIGDASAWLERRLTDRK